MFMALLGNDIFQYAVVITLLLLVAIRRFIGLKKTGKWLVGANKPAKRKAKTAAQKKADKEAAAEEDAD